MKAFNTSDILEVSTSHVRCNGRVNTTLHLVDKTEVNLYNLTMKQADDLDAYCQLKGLILTVDERFLTLSDETWLAQNGIKEA